MPRDPSPDALSTGDLTASTLAAGALAPGDLTALVPTALHDDEADALAAGLAGDERVRAVARPTRAPRPAALTAAYVLAAVALVASVGLFAAGAASAALVSTLLAALSAVLIGVADRRARRVTAYAVTDRRLVVLTDGAGGVRADAVAERALARRRLDVRTGGRGRIRLVGAARAVSVGAIDDVRAFNALLDALPGGAPSATDGAPVSAMPASELPAADAFRDADVDRIARALEPGERVLWMGQPEPTWGVKQTMNGMQKHTAASIWPVFVIAGIIAAIGIVGSALGDAIAMAMPAVQVLSAGYALWLTRQLRRRSLYVVTDRRALVGLPGVRSYTVRTFAGPALAGATTASGTGGRRSVAFADPDGLAATEPGYRGGRVRKIEWTGPSGPGFEFIRDAEAVAALVRRVAAGDAPPGDLLARRLPERAATSVEAERAALERQIAARDAVERATAEHAASPTQPIGLPDDALTGLDLAGLDDVDELVPGADPTGDRSANRTRA